MNPAEYGALSRAEELHAWYIGLRDTITQLLRSPRFQLPPNPRVLDAGCGTGANLRLLETLLKPSLLAGFDWTPVALAAAKAKVPHALLWRDDLRRPAASCAPLDLVISMDVLCITGVEPAKPGLARLVDQMRPGGLMMLNLPAHEWLRSGHDVAGHIKERYVADDIRRLLVDLDLVPEVVTYRVCLMFPAVVATRLAKRRAAAGKPPSAVRSDLHEIPNPVANAALLATLKLENRAIAAGVGMPWGSSVFAVGRKPR